MPPVPQAGSRSLRTVPGVASSLSSSMNRMFTISRMTSRGTRSASENFMVAMTAARGVPCRYGQTSGITTGQLGADSTRSASLYSDAGSTCRDFDYHGPYLTGAGRHLAGTATPDFTEFFTASLEGSAPGPASAAHAE